ncbi:GmrSD restriction endonuclease domain-containing protein [Ralstonia sp. 25C]|uniref:GmrSD restriction endonuclease domain-containing protein n=1 Tax=Ralstonia sp. 25C TaxID=3447363 RepID=UPI003F7554C2
MSVGERLSFAALFERHPEVCIPILQRDYAQGRAAEAEVRAAFLQALRDALDKPEDDHSLPLDLDFVYGSLDSRGSFAPLDGQQRLTTLLLLHWYLAAKDGYVPDFMRRESPARGARFTYAVRPSSREFFDALLDWQPEQRRNTKLSADIADQPWFFRSWTMDPTIQSALTMLDEIDARFADAKGLYERLTSRDRPAITFQLLDLQDFGLSDDLYIKMNARGKPLTSFETFKARLEHHVDSVVPDARFEMHDRQVGASEYISHRIDTAWADVLWHYRDRQTALFDDRFMNLVRAVVMVTRRPDERSHDALMYALRDGQQAFSFVRYQQAGCLDEPFARTFVALLDAWSGHEAGIRPLLPKGCAFDEQAFIERLLKDAPRLSYAELVQFRAYCGFLTSHPHGGAPAFGEWMRVVVNLSSNTPYDRLDDFTRSSQSVDELLEHATEILSYLAAPTGKLVRGFYGQQVREERIKASLMLRDEDWRGTIESAERHGYFAGQIEFLLDFSGVLEDWNELTGFTWSPDQEVDRLVQFTSYRDKAFAVFADDGLRALPQYLWERALLVHGDYLLHVGRNHSFLHNAERDESWKRLLRAGQGDEAWAKRKLVQAVLDDIDVSRGVEASLAELVQVQTPEEPWRALLVQHPEAIAYCGRRNMRRGVAGRVYLLRKTRMSGEHAELLTYVLYRRLLAAVKTGDLIYYVSVSSDEVEPFVSGLFAGRHGRLSVRVERDEQGLLITVGPPDTEAANWLPQGFVDELAVQGFGFAGGRLVARASLPTAEQMLIDMAARAKAWDFEPVPKA